MSINIRAGSIDDQFALRLRAGSVQYEGPRLSIHGGSVSVRSDGPVANILSGAEDLAVKSITISSGVRDA